MANTQLWAHDKDRPFRLAGRLIDPTTRTIEYDGQQMTVEPRVLALLLKLAETPGEPQRREALIDAVWPGSPGAESSLSNAISLLRQALDDSAVGDARLINTVPKFGYCLTVAPQPCAATEPDLQAEPSSTPGVLRRRLPFVGVGIVLGLVALAWSRHSEPPPLDPVRSTTAQPFVAVTPIDAPASAAPLANVLVRDAAKLLERAATYRVADTSEAYQVAAGTLVADLVLSASLSDSADGPVLTAEWMVTATGETVAVRRILAPPGAVLALRRDWLEAVVVETALALSEAGFELSVGSADTEVADASNAQWLEPPTAVATAFEAYASGLWKTSQYRADLMLDAITDFEQAVALDPAFAIAWADLGNAYLAAGSHQGALPPQRAHAKAREAMLRAVTLQPDLAEAHNALADYYNCIEREPLLAQRAFDSVFALDPDFATPGYTRLLLLHDSRQAAVAQIERNVSRFPDSLFWRLVGAQNLLAAQEPELALDYVDAVLAAAPGMQEARFVRARALSMLGRHAGAIAEFESLLAEAPSSTRYAALLVVTLARAGQDDDAEALFQTTLVPSDRTRPTHLAMALAWIGQIDKAFEQLELALAQREFGMCYVAAEPIYEPLRADPRFASIVQRMRGAKAAL
ncbi:MAG: tetratricopeptide repeat protein [Pseudomonadota bacterium]